MNNHRILRISAWLLLLGTPLALFTGFLTTKYFLMPQMGYGLSYYLHTVVVPLVFIPLFYLHSLAGILNLVSRNARLNKVRAKQAIGVAWTGVFVLFLALYLAQVPAQNVAFRGNSTFLSQNSTSHGQSGVLLTLQEVGRHNSASDCWLAISGKVYNVTDYIAYHPGNPSHLELYCGSDATAAFATKGGKGAPHSQNAVSILDSLYIGDIGGTAAAQAANNNNSLPAQGTRGGGEED